MLCRNRWACVRYSNKEGPFKSSNPMRSFNMLNVLPGELRVKYSARCNYRIGRKMGSLREKHIKPKHLLIFCSKSLQKHIFNQEFYADCSHMHTPSSFVLSYE